MLRILALALISCASLTACAYTTVIPIDAHDRTTPGQRVYDTKPILIVSQTGAQVVFIPNYSKSYAVQFGAFLAKNEFSIKTENGSITQLDSKLDDTNIIDLLKVFADKLLPSVPGARTTGGEPTTGAAIAVFDFVFDDRGNIVKLVPFFLPLPKNIVAATGGGSISGPVVPKAPQEKGAVPGKSTPRSG